MDHAEPRDPIADGYYAASGRTAGFTYRPYPTGHIGPPESVPGPDGQIVKGCRPYLPPPNPAAVAVDH